MFVFGILDCSVGDHRLNRKKREDSEDSLGGGQRRVALTGGHHARRSVLERIDGRLNGLRLLVHAGRHFHRRLLFGDLSEKKGENRRETRMITHFNRNWRWASMA